MNELALFAGAGGGILGGKLLGWRTVCAVECDAYAAQVLSARQNDGALEPFPIWSDVCSFDGRPWAGIVEVISGGFPCQDISVAGRRAGIEGARSGLWSEFARIIGEVRPRFVFVENSPGLTHRGLGRVLGDLAHLGFDAEWCVLGADNAGAPHIRKRIWILAHSRSAWGQDHELRPGRDEPRVCGPELPEPHGDEHEGQPHEIGRTPPPILLGHADSLRIQGLWTEIQTDKAGPPSQGEQIPNPMRPRLPKREQEALLPAGGGKKGEQLVNYIAHFPTPRAGSSNGGGTGLDGGSNARRALARDHGEVEAKALLGGQLNPPWVEWLMGWPIGWTDLKPLETARSRKWPHSHSEPSTAA